MIDTKAFTDEQLVELVHSFDRQGLPLSRRFDGDDRAIRDLMEKHKILPVVANVALVMTVLLREATIRGLVIPPVN
jgi:hypothetical protein